MNAREYLPLATLLRLLAVLALALAPHALRIPLWETLLIAGLLGWRAVAAQRQWRMPPGWLRLLLTVAAFAGIYASYGRVSGQHAGTALLCIMAALKLVELRARRDVMFIVFLMYFLLLTHFLFSQEMWTVLYLLASTVGITALLIECQHLGALAPRRTLRTASILVLQALPLMLMLFVLFPRIPGPLWGLPADAGAARSGLTDRVSPGDISELTRSEGIAFRVSFDGEPPAPAQRYWRGPVLDGFDGRSWEKRFPGSPYLAPPPIDFAADAADVGYSITLEAHRMPWLFALDMPRRETLPPESFIGRDGELLANAPVIERRQYRLQSRPRYRLEPELGNGAHRRYTALPENYNPRTLAFAAALREQHADPRQRVRAMLRHFNGEDFVYTLQPPPLGRHSVDEFLFDTRRGYCEHYASAFAVVMRAAGVPARVIAGYQGGQRNAIGDYFVVRQADAHAWNEVWLAGEGWVRVDPTAAIAPSRIEAGGSAAALSEQDRDYAGSLAARTRLRFYLEARWDWLNMQWNSWVLAYGPELQQNLLGRLGIGDLRSMILTLTLAGTGVLALIGWWTLRRFTPQPQGDASLRQWRRLTAQLARAGYAQRADEGPRDFALRVATAQPRWAPALQQVTELYLRQRYLAEADADTAQALKAAVRRARDTIRRGGASTA